MAMVKHFEAPGSAEWHARRARCFNAGDASAVLGCHPSGKTRTQLLQELHTGVEQEFSDYVQQRVIDPGHRVEARWRPIAEEIVGEDLAVIAGSLDVGLSRPLGASLDGITFMEDLLGECKSANEALRGALPHEGRDSHQRNDARQLPKGYRVQLEQQQLVTGASRTLFSACRFNDDGSVDEERHCWYSSDPALRAEILAGWRQFDADLAAYVPPSPAAVERVAAEPVEALPAVFVKVEGSIVIRENFDVFEQAMRDFLEHRLIRQPKSDQDFADL
ncbi:MAG TPA: YqaJ viral recombinase family protein, partial [Ramlibacter sp.]|nr:YqaJ viral recombinase family protein [Ramlibacter sp.]